MRKIIKNTDPIDWKSTDLTYLIKDRYDPVFESRINACPVMTVSDLATTVGDMKCAQIRYGNEKEFVAIADTLGIMNDFKVSERSSLSIIEIVSECRYK